VATLHLHAGRHPEDPQLTELIGELSLNSTTFRRLWAGHDVLAHATGTNASTTGSSATSPSTTSSWPSKATRTRASSSRPPNPHHPTAEALGILAIQT
jgi:hypothetical protein